MFSSFLNRANGFLFSPSSRMAPIPHYIYDILHENPFRALQLINYEFVLGEITGCVLSFLFWFSIYGNVFHFFQCNWIICGWVVSVFLMHMAILVPRFIISLQIKRLGEFMRDIQEFEQHTDPQDLLRNLMWNQLFQTKIYYFTQTIMRNISLFFFSGIILLIIDSGEHGFTKACADDHGLKKISAVVVLLCVTKFLLVKKMILKPDPDLRVKRFNQDESLKAKRDERVCSICLMDFEPNQEVIFLSCKHFYHKICIAGWIRIKRKCPLCNNF